MHRPRRLLRKAAIVLSLVAAVSWAALWARSYYVADRVAFGVDGRTPDGSPTRHMAVTRSNRGRIVFTGYHIHGFMLTERGSLNPSGWYATHLATTDDIRIDVAWEKWGLRYLRYRYPALNGQGVQFPIWFLVLIFSVAPIVWLIRFFLRPKAASGRCLVCGYDLRATPDRCPECGNSSIAGAADPEATMPK